MEYQQEMERQRQMIEARLGQAFPGQGLGQAMAYSLMAGGKRIRPILTLEFCRAAGGIRNRLWMRPVVWKCFTPIL